MTKVTFEGKRVLILTAHADDCEFFAGGLAAKMAARGAELTEVIATDNGRGSFELGETELVRRSREEEAEAARRIIGKKELIFLGYPDGFLDETPKNELRRIYMEQIRRVRPHILLSFDPFASFEPHPDHRHVAMAALEAAGFAHLPLYHPEQIEAGYAPHKIGRFYWFAKHGGNVNHVEDIGDFMDTKLESLRAHESQMRMTIQDLRLSMETSGRHPELLPLLDVDHFDPALDLLIRTWARSVASEMEFEYGEAYRLEIAGDLLDQVGSV